MTLIKTQCITTLWYCNDCDFVAEVPLFELPEMGGPVCANSGEDMIMKSSALVTL